MERREFPRIEAPVFCRPVGRPFFGHRRAADVSMGGMRLYADEAPAVGDRLELELSLPDQSRLVCRAEVVWVDKLGEGAPARFDVGVKFVEISKGDGQRLAAVLAAQREL